MGFCGWDKFDQPKYLDSKNHGYKAKLTTLYGMEKLYEYYLSDVPVYVVEGIVCCLYLRSIGLQALALLGSSMTTYVVQVLRRFRKRLFVIPDNDVVGKEVHSISNRPAGEHLVGSVKKYLPEAKIIQTVTAKDIDDTRKVPDIEEEFKRDLASVACNPYIKFKTIIVR